MEKVSKAVIPAAGFGTRFLPATKTQPKEMLPIVDKPAIHFVVEEVLKSGIKDILIVTGRGKRAIEDYFDKNVELEEHLMAAGKTELLKEVEDLSDLAEVHYIRQKEQMGLGHAIYCARNHIAGEPFAVLLGDTIVENRVPCTKQLVDLYRRLNGSIVAVEEVSKENIEKYGIFGGKMVDGKTMDIEIMVEKPNLLEAPSNLGAIGRYILTPQIFEALEQTRPGVSGEIQLTDALCILLKTQKVYAHKFDGVRYDIGDKLDYLRATVEFALRRKDVGPEFKEYLKGVLA